MRISFYVNNSASEFETKKFGGANAKTLSRRYDIEERYQYFYGLNSSEIVEYEVAVPMMFVQEEKLADFANDVNAQNSYLNVSINLNAAYLEKIQADYATLIQVFEAHKEDIDANAIVSYIGSPKNLN